MVLSLSPTLYLVSGVYLLELVLVLVARLSRTATEQGNRLEIWEPSTLELGFQEKQAQKIEKVHQKQKNFAKFFELLISVFCFGCVCEFVGYYTMQWC